MTPEQERVYLASQWQLMWWKFRKRLACSHLRRGDLRDLRHGGLRRVPGAYHYTTRNTDFIRAPSQSIHLFHEGSFIGPFVYPYTMRLNMENLKREYEVDATRPQKLRFFCKGDDYVLGPDPRQYASSARPRGGTFFFLGSDRLGFATCSRAFSMAGVSRSRSACSASPSPSCSASSSVASWLLWRPCRPHHSAHHRDRAVAAAYPRSGWHWPRSCRRPGARSWCISASR